jgi:integrase
MGLSWKDINFNKNTLTVKQSSQYIPGQGTFSKDPKNDTSIRTITVPASVMTLIKQYKAYQAEERLRVGDLWQGSDRIFTTWDGKPGHPEWPSQWFSKFIKKHNLPPLNFHGLRHTAATLWIGQGGKLKNISSRLGHANIGTTGDIYAHALKSGDREIADRMDSIFTENIK